MSHIQQNINISFAYITELLQGSSQACILAP